MSLRECHRCQAITKYNHQCRRRTCRTMLCFQHLRILEGLQLKKSYIPQAELGLFATKNYNINENVARYTGDISVERIEGPYVFQVNQNKFIDAKKTSTSAGRYANDCRVVNRNQGHCRGNNAKLSYDYHNERANLKAIRPIRVGDEIYVQ